MLIGENLSIGSSMDRAPPGSKTKRDCLIKDNLAINVLKPLKWQMEGRRVVLLGIEPRTSVLSRQLSLSLSYDAQFQRSSDSIAQIIYLCLDDLYRSLDLEKYVQSIKLPMLHVIHAQILSIIHHTQQSPLIYVSQ